ncbi:uncharacterized protein LOC110840392 isoform X2 [Zootermopsis nevadensis]|uniref:uncharacterized protein LOC110840392 isoform X2 n=1 Tax=Zootermopsis nevadensis TaxID=136037 RepID=UPI000B8EE38D|nr:uncharacterized protein LOC110840392 isoform X2 [Zootermopsis nevadensis]
MSFITNLTHKSWTSMKMRFSKSNPEKKLFTPGPLVCSQSVKEAMLRDLGSRDGEFINVVKLVRQKLLDIAEVSPEEFTAVLLQGCGTYAVEAVFQTCTPRHGGRVKELLEKGVQYALVAVVHCETSTGSINPVEELGQTIKQYQPQAAYLVDAMSSFGAVPVKIQNGQIDYLVSSANKCLQGVPGFSYVIARKSELFKCRGNSRSLSLDLADQYEGFEGNGQFRFTPPTHTLLGFLQALQEFQEEGGVNGRAKRYKQNCTVLQRGMEELGFCKLLSRECGGYIITTYHYPNHPNFNFEEFYCKLCQLGQLIYPGKLSNANCFRIGNIGDLYPSDMKYLLKCIGKVLDAMDVPVPVPVPAPICLCVA